MKWTLTFIDKCFHVCADATKTLFFFLLRKIANSFSYDTKKCKLYVKEDTITSLLTFARNLFMKTLQFTMIRSMVFLRNQLFFLVLLVSIIAMVFVLQQLLLRQDICKITLGLQSYPKLPFKFILVLYSLYILVDSCCFIQYFLGFL